MLISLIDKEWWERKTEEKNPHGGVRATDHELIKAV